MRVLKQDTEEEESNKGTNEPFVSHDIINKERDVNFMRTYIFILTSLQLQKGEQYDWFLKHSQYNLRHFDFRQLHETPSPEEVLEPWLHTGD